MDYDQEECLKWKIYDVYKIYTPIYQKEIYDPEFEKLHMFRNNSYDDCVRQVKKYISMVHLASNNQDEELPMVFLKYGDHHETHVRHDSSLDNAPLVQVNAYIYHGSRNIIKQYFKKYPITESDIFCGFLIEGK